MAQNTLQVYHCNKYKYNLVVTPALCYCSFNFKYTLADITLLTRFKLLNFEEKTLCSREYPGLRSKLDKVYFLHYLFFLLNRCIGWVTRYN